MDKQVWICTTCKSNLLESKQTPKCQYCMALMREKKEILDEWIEKYSPLFAQLFNSFSPLYSQVYMISDESADLNTELTKLDEQHYEKLNSIIDEVGERLPIAVILNTTSRYMNELSWDDFEYNPPINLLDPITRLGFLFFLDFLCLVLVHAILRDQKQPNTAATLNELKHAHDSFNHLIYSEAAGVEEMREPKAKWPVLIYGLFADYIPPLYGISAVWNEAANYKKS